MATALVVACEQNDSPVGPAANDPSFQSTAEQFKETHPIETTITDLCSGEELLLVGEARNTTILVSGPESITHIVVVGLIKGTATSLTSGTTYRFYDEFHFSFQTPNLISPDFTTFTHDQSLTVSLGGGENLFLDFDVHVVGNANEVKTTVENFTGECRG
jgi:hypothetical protein